VRLAVSAPPNDPTNWSLRLFLGGELFVEHLPGGWSRSPEGPPPAPLSEALSEREQRQVVQWSLFRLQVERRVRRRPLTPTDAQEVLSSILPGGEVTGDGDRLLIRYRGIAFFSANRDGGIEWVAPSVPTPETPPVGSPEFARGRALFRRGVLQEAAGQGVARRPSCGVRPRARALRPNTRARRAASRGATRAGPSDDGGSEGEPPGLNPPAWRRTSAGGPR
jgi:hypothetical protein